MIKKKIGKGRNVNGLEKNKFQINDKKISKEFMALSWDERVLRIKQKKEWHWVGIKELC